MSSFVSDRREIKYLIDEGTLAQFDRCVRPVLTLDKNNPGDRGYYNYTIYFDSPGHRYWREKEEGLRSRLKPRLRIYKSAIDEGPTNYFLEFKHREDQFIGKDRCPLSPDTANRIISGHQLTDRDLTSSPVLAKFQYLRQRFNLSPQVCILYHRFAYSIPFHHRLRITYDRRLQCSRDVTFAVPPESFEYFQPPEKLVLEIKYNGSAPGWLINVCSRLGLQRISFSKYAEGLEYAYRGAHTPLRQCNG